MYDTFLAPKYEQAAEQMTQLNKGMEEANSSEASLLERAQEMKKLLGELGARTKEYAHHLLKLVIVFVIQAAVLPLATLFILIKLLKWLAGATGTLAFEESFRRRATKKTT